MSVESLLGTSPGIFLTMTVIIMGGAAYMTGQALAGTWRPLWQLFVYCGLLGLATRFLIYALFEGRLLSITGLLADVLVLTTIGLLSYRLRQVSRFVQQYPWLYERSSPLTYRRKLP